MNALALFLFVFPILSTVVAKRASSALSELGAEDVSRLLDDSEFVYSQLQCVLGRGHCDNTGHQLKFAIPEVLVRKCRSCSPEQARNAQRLIDFVQSNYPDEFRQIRAKYGRRG